MIFFDSEMINLLYPSVRIGRMITVALPVYKYTGSYELCITSCILCDSTSILADSRQFFDNWNQFFLAALFLPWFYKSYWEQFINVFSIKDYAFELLSLAISIIYFVSS